MHGVTMKFNSSNNYVLSR